MSLNNTSDGLSKKTRHYVQPHVKVRAIAKSDETQVVEMLRKRILPLETAGSSLVTTHRVLKGLYDFYSKPGNKYIIVPEDDEILTGIGISTLAGLPLAEKVAELRDFVHSSRASATMLNKFLDLSVDTAKAMGYEKLYVKIQSGSQVLRKSAEALKFHPVEDQSSKLNEHVKGDMFFRRL